MHILISWRRTDYVGKGLVCTGFEVSLSVVFKVNQIHWPSWKLCAFCMSFSHVTSYKRHHYVNLKSLIVLFTLSLYIQCCLFQVKQTCSILSKRGGKNLSWKWSQKTMLLQIEGVHELSWHLAKCRLQFHMSSMRLEMLKTKFPSSTKATGPQTFSMEDPGD